MLLWTLVGCLGEHGCHKKLTLDRTLAKRRRNKWTSSCSWPGCFSIICPGWFSRIKTFNLRIDAFRYHPWDFSVWVPGVSPGWGLDMAVVICKGAEDEDDVLEAMPAVSHLLISGMWNLYGLLGVGWNLDQVLFLFLADIPIRFGPINIVF